MGKLYTLLVISFLILFVINIIFASLTIYSWVTGGLQNLLEGMNLGERIVTSNQIKWIILVDFIWFGAALVFLFKRKHYKTDIDKHYFAVNSIVNPKVCVIIPTYNEEDVVTNVVNDYKNEKFVSNVLVIDNHSNDNTVLLAKQSGAEVITKQENLGYGHSCYLGLKEAIKKDINIIILTECDGTFAANDIQKMIPYIDNCDMVIGTRQVQVLTEKGNQNSMFYVWGNYLLAKLIQIKYFSLTNLGIVELTDVGCLYRCIRKDSLEKIKDELKTTDAKKIRDNPNNGLIANFLTMVGIENNLKLVEVPITFKKRIGISKSGANKKLKAINYGLRFFWYILIK
jgi:glycosyltransferase involved in cell wall biosynthesis